MMERIAQVTIALQNPNFLRGNSPPRALYSPNELTGLENFKRSINAPLHRPPRSTGRLVPPAAIGQKFPRNPRQPRAGTTRSRGVSMPPAAIAQERGCTRF